MCSLSWIQGPDGYEIFFNRDERKTRLRARPPAREVLNGVSFLSPRDGNAGGTWLLVNEYGVALALLNYWPEELQDTLPGAVSRGKWLWHLAGHRSAEAALDEADRVLPLGCAPFTLAVFDPDQREGPVLRRWLDGRWQPLGGSPPICSSSYQPAKVIQAREDSYKKLPQPDADSLWRWHSLEDHPHAASVRMLRPDAQTWSVSRVTVRKDGVSWLYREELPELALPPVEHQSCLQRVEVAG